MRNFFKTIVSAKDIHHIVTRNIAWNYIGYLYQIGINLALTAYIVRRAPIAEYGMFLFITSLSSTLYVLDLGLSGLLVKAYVEMRLDSDRSRLNELINTAFLALFALGAVGVFFSAIFAAILPGPFDIPSRYAHESSVLYILTGFVIQINLPCIALEHAYQASHRFDRINQIRVVTSTIQIALSVAAIATGYSIVALTVVQIFSSTLRLFLFATALPMCVPHAHLSLRRFNRNLFMPLIRLSKLAFLDNLAASSFVLLAWKLLGSLGSIKEATIYGLAIKLPDQLWNMIDKGASVALTFLSRSCADDDLEGVQRIYLTTQRILFGVVLPFVVLGSFAAKPLIDIWAGSQYTSAALVIQYLLLGVTSHAAGYSSNQLLYASEQVKTATKIALWEYILSIACSLPLIARYRASGLATGIAISQLCLNFGWLTWKACEISHTSLLAMLKYVIDGLTWPLTILATKILALWSISAHLSPPLVVIAVLLSGCIYLGVWTIRAALPIYRSGSEMIA